ncbi:MAG: hypothetical protein PHH01_00735 [Patescibacteria group bacterium]|nr:hypothetical protein [Patescibacteria group bacterium]MDD5566699.1 hypothetical protein [Patescibacteria group bacterium]
MSGTQGVIHNPVTGQGDCRPGEIPGVETTRSAVELEQTLHGVTREFNRKKLIALAELLRLVHAAMPQGFDAFLPGWTTSQRAAENILPWLEALSSDQRNQIAGACLIFACRQLGPADFRRQLERVQDQEMRRSGS